MTVDFRNPEKCETCGHCDIRHDSIPIVDYDGLPVAHVGEATYDCLVYGGRPLRVRADGYCVMWEPTEEREREK